MPRLTSGPSVRWWRMPNCALVMVRRLWGVVLRFVTRNWPMRRFLGILPGATFLSAAIPDVLSDTGLNFVDLGAMIGASRFFPFQGGLS
jgi:hypothetical protein